MPRPKKDTVRGMAPKIVMCWKMLDEVRYQPTFTAKPVLLKGISQLLKNNRCLVCVFYNYKMRGKMCLNDEQI